MLLLPETASPALPRWEEVEPGELRLDCPDCGGKGTESSGWLGHIYGPYSSETCGGCSGEGVIDGLCVLADYYPADFGLRVDADGTCWRMVP